MLATALGLLALPSAYMGLAWGLQRTVLFPPLPRPKASGPPATADVRVLWVGGAQRTETWFLAPPSLASFTTVIFAHGNGEHIDDWLEPFETLRRMGVGVLLVEYPGYGRSAGRPSEASITKTMVAAYDELLTFPGVSAQRIVAYGRSLGGGAACALANQRPLAGMILESTFTSVTALAKNYGLPKALVRDPFDNLSTVRAFTQPILLVHGRRDRIIPFEHSERLHAAAPKAALHALDCGHNDCPRQWSLIETFLADLDV